jgi:hypothetical protein
MMNPALMWFLETALIIGAVIATIYLIRRHKPDGLAAVIVAPVNIITASATRFGDWLRAGSTRLKQHADEHGRIVFANAAHPLATGLMYVGLASLWLTVTVFYVLRSATIVLAPHTELVRAERATNPGFLDPKPAAPLMALAEVFAPVMLTAVAGIVVLELLGFTDHIPFLHRERRFQKILLSAFAMAVLAVAMVMQSSIATQDSAMAENDVMATIQARRDADIAPLPERPTADEVRIYDARTEDFERAVATPLIAAHNATVGPTGWRTWLPIGAALVDFVFAFALVPAVVMLWLVAVRILRAPLELLRAAANGLAYVARLIGGVILRTLGLRDPGAAVDNTENDPPAPTPATPAGSVGPHTPAPQAPAPSTHQPPATAAPTAPQAVRPTWAGSATNTSTVTEPDSAPLTSSIDRFNPFASSANR